VKKKIKGYNSNSSLEMTSELENVHLHTNRNFQMQSSLSTVTQWKAQDCWK